jgi:hypothetical protein
VVVAAAGTAWHGILMTWTMRFPGFQATVTHLVLRGTSGAPAQGQLQLLVLSAQRSQASGSSCNTTSTASRQTDQEGRETASSWSRGCSSCSEGQGTMPLDHTCRNCVGSKRPLVLCEFSGSAGAECAHITFASNQLMLTATEP